MTTTIIFSVLSALVGAAIAYLAARTHITALKAREKYIDDENKELKKQAEERRQHIRQLVDERAALAARRDVLQSEAANLERQMDDLRIALSHQRDDDRQQYERQLEELRRQHRTQMEQQATLVKEQINTITEDILKRRSEELSAHSQEQLSAILTPLRENLRQMKEAVEKSDREHTTSMERLDAAIKANLEKAREVGERADKLAQALTSDNKAQGNFGELRLRTLLEEMGFEVGVQFEEQVTLRDERGTAVREEENGRRMIPDVILHFPDKRDVVIDSKMSMKAFEDYFNADGEEERADALKRHLLSVRNHVRELAHKNYSRYIHEGRQKPDFVMMYVYNESALQLALAHDATLYKEAYDQGVIISGSQNMYMMLRVLEMTWRQVRQAENQEEIMKTANELVNRVQLFYERFNQADDLLKRTQEAFDKLRITTSPTGKGIITAATRLLHYGAKENPKRNSTLPRKEE